MRQLRFRDNLAKDNQTGRWWVRVMVHGTVVQRSFRTKHAALQLLNELELERVGIRAPATEKKLSEVAAEFLVSRQELGRAQNTIEYYKRHFDSLMELLPDVPLSAIAKRDIMLVVEKRREANVGNASINKEIADLLRLYRFAELKPSWKWTPLSAQHRERWVRPPADVARLWRLLPEPTRAAVGLCLLAGLRASEAYAAKASWCHFETGELWVPVRKTNTTNRTALVQTLADVLPRSGVLVQASENAVSHHLRSASKAAGISPPYSGPGAFRHHCATWAVEAGYTQEQVATVLAHVRPGVTSRYIHGQAVTLKREILEAVESQLLSALDASSGPDRGYNEVTPSYPDRAK